jgi:hypothetical protein
MSGLRCMIVLVGIDYYAQGGTPITEKVGSFQVSIISPACAIDCDSVFEGGENARRISDTNIKGNLRSDFLYVS